MTMHLVRGMTTINTRKRKRHITKSQIRTLGKRKTYLQQRHETIRYAWSTSNDYGRIYLLCPGNYRSQTQP